MRPGESCSLQTAPQQQVVETSDSELEELLRDTPEIFRFRDPEPVQLDEMDEAGEAIQEHLGRAFLNGSFKFRDPEQLNEGSGF